MATADSQSNMSQTQVPSFWSIQKSIDEMSKTQELFHLSLKFFIQQEFHKLKHSVLQGCADAKDESLASGKGTQKLGDAVVDIDSLAVSHVSLDDVDVWLTEPNQTNDKQTAHEPDHQIDRLTSLPSKKWSDFQKAVVEVEDHHNSYKRMMTKILARSESMWIRLFRHYGLSEVLDKEEPTNCLAKVAGHRIFVTIQFLLIFSNTGIMAYEADEAIKSAMQVPKSEVSRWLETCNLVFNLAFAVELLFRMIALRSWFWVSPEWGWNVFDVCIVASSLLHDVLGGINFTFIRTFRLLRAFRAVRVVRVLRFFRELRKIMFAMLACLGSLLWCFVFLGLTMFIFSILLLQGVVDSLNEMEPNSEEHLKAIQLASEWYGSLGSSMFALLAASLLGEDFATFLDPLERAGYLYTSAFVMYILFIIVGVMNVLTGVFLASADEFTDRALIVQSEQMSREDFVTQMIDVFKELGAGSNSVISWPQFNEALKNEDLQAYLASHGLEASHARLLFDLIDEDKVGTIDLSAFVMGMLSLKGNAKSLDTRVIEREIAMLPQILMPERVNELTRTAG